MANTRSAEKRYLQAEKARARNASIRSSVRTAMKKVREAVAKNDVAGAQELLKQAASTIDKAATKGVIKDNSASRKVARLSRAVHLAAAAK